MLVAPPVLTRWSFVRNQLWYAQPFRLVLGGLSLLTAILSAAQAWRSELAPVEQGKYRFFFSAIPDWSWQSYLCIGLACLCLMLFETAFRLYRSILSGKNQRAALTGLWNDGFLLQRACLTRSMADPEPALIEWTQRVLKEVSAIDPSYVMEFQNQAHMAVSHELLDHRIADYPESDSFKQCYMWITWRMSKLVELGADLRNAQQRRG